MICIYCIRYGIMMILIMLIYLKMIKKDLKIYLNNVMGYIGRNGILNFSNSEFQRIQAI